ncbi:DUF72 domain-containing protein [Nocardioides ferulae]|uniref:DUF72 domain-containing protein n=1 Tax=Nocardioides ferulae TaxID=2340821 RepID=UPI001F0BFCB8|nr:DUF72 domain-containing protein [Nocardioides ferulae]
MGGDPAGHRVGMSWAHIGTSGWSYDHWAGVLYPPGLPSARRRDVYTAHFDTVELNASFYRWPREQTFASWNSALPPGFTMTVKAPRGLTHARRLRDEDGVWRDRLVRSWHALRDRRGVLLVQLHPAHERDDARLDWFLASLPEWMRVAVEFRHPSWHADEVFALLERRGAAYVVMSGAGLPCVLRATAPFVYVRLHGPSHDQLYAGSYSDADLGWWADRVREWQGQGREVFAYFNNDGEGHAVRNADTLRHLLGQPVPG